MVDNYIFPQEATFGINPVFKYLSAEKSEGN